MMRNCVAILFSILAFNAVAAPAENWQQLLREIKVSKPSMVRYVQQRHLHFLTQPVVTAGVFYFQPPDYLKQHIASPTKQDVVINEENVTITTEQGTRTVQLQQYPALWVISATLRALLAGNEAFLQHYYAIILKVEAPGWVLVLTPKINIESNLTEIKISGKKKQIETITIQYKNGDWIYQQLSKVGTGLS